MCYILQLSSLDSLPYRQAAFLCHSLGKPWEAAALATSGSQCCRPCHCWKGKRDSVSVAFPSQPFTGFWKREFLLLLLMLFLFSKNHQILVLSVWHPLISTRKAHQCNSVYIALETLQDATEVSCDFFFPSLIAFMLSARTKEVSVNYLCICWNH